MPRSGAAPRLGRADPSAVPAPAVPRSGAVPPIRPCRPPGRAAPRAVPTPRPCRSGGRAAPRPCRDPRPCRGSAVPSPGPCPRWHRDTNAATGRVTDRHPGRPCHRSSLRPHGPVAPGHRIAFENGARCSVGAILPPRGPDAGPCRSPGRAAPPAVPTPRAAPLPRPPRATPPACDPTRGASAAIRALILRRGAADTRRFIEPDPASRSVTHDAP
jgi:hypothetical protein